METQDRQYWNEMETPAGKFKTAYETCWTLLVHKCHYVTNGANQESSTGELIAKAIGDLGKGCNSKEAKR